MMRGAITLFFMIMFVSCISAAQTLGTFEMNSDVTLIQSCDSSTYSNITKITYPNSSLALDGDVVMIVQGDTYSYVFSDTNDLGRYLVYGHCDENGQDTVWAYDFEITYTGQKVSLSNTIIVFALLMLSAVFLVIAWFFKQEYWMLKSFFQLLSVLSVLIAINSARIIASESDALGVMGEMGLLAIVVTVSFYFLWIFVKAFIEVIKIIKSKRGLRWKY